MSSERFPKSAQQLAADVQLCLSEHHRVGYEPVWGERCPVCVERAPFAALDALVARVTDLETQVEGWRARRALAATGGDTQQPPDRFFGRGHCECERRKLPEEAECLYDEPCLKAVT